MYQTESVWFKEYKLKRQQSGQVVRLFNKDALLNIVHIPQKSRPPITFQYYNNGDITLKLKKKKTLPSKHTSVDKYSNNEIKGKATKNQSTALWDQLVWDETFRVLGAVAVDVGRRPTCFLISNAQISEDAKR